MRKIHTIVQGRTVPLAFWIKREGSGLGADLSGASVTMRLVRLPENFHGRDEGSPFRSTGVGTVFLDYTAVTPDPDQDANTGKVEWDPEQTLVDIAPSDYGVQFKVVFGSGKVEVTPELGELVLAVVP